jgi:hypothetical protein
MKCDEFGSPFSRYALPGRPVAMMLFKTWGYIVWLRLPDVLTTANSFPKTMAQALSFTSDFKLGHYMKGEQLCFLARASH